MNIYARYFDRDILVYNIDELIDFLSSIPDIHVTEELVADIHSYIHSELPYPKRYKVRPRVYFILIKTSANSMEEFKANRKQLTGSVPTENTDVVLSKKEMKAARLMEECEGWYQGSITFKRVIQIPGTTKFQYQDTTFMAQVKANSGQECYNRIVHHLKNRQDIDLRSQFPSAKGQNFHCFYLGETRPAVFEQENVE